MLETASKIHSDSAGVKLSQALDAPGPAAFRSIDEKLFTVKLDGLENKEIFWCCDLQPIEDAEGRVPRCEKERDVAMRGKRIHSGFQDEFHGQPEVPKTKAITILLASWILVA